MTQPWQSERQRYPPPLRKAVGLSPIPHRLGGEFEAQFRTGNLIAVSGRISIDRWAVQGETMRGQIETMSVNRTHYRHRTGSEDSQTPVRNSDPIAVESCGDLASRHGSIVRIAAAHSWFYRSDNPICTRTQVASITMAGFRKHRASPSVWHQTSSTRCHRNMCCASLSMVGCFSHFEYASWNDLAIVVTSAKRNWSRSRALFNKK